jgi:chemotaxis protein CheC
MHVDSTIIDAIRELINIGVGNAAAKLAELTNAKIILEIPEIKIIPLADISHEALIAHDRQLATVCLEFRGVFSGRTALMIPPNSAANLVSILTHEPYDAAELDAVMVDTLKEVGNIIVNGVMGTISNILSERLEYSLPSYHQGFARAIISEPGWAPEKEVIIANTRFRVSEKNIVGHIVMILDVGSLDALIVRIRSLQGNE